MLIPSHNIAFCYLKKALSPSCYNNYNLPCSDLLGVINSQCLQLRLLSPLVKFLAVAFGWDESWFEIDFSTQDFRLEVVNCLQILRKGLENFAEFETVSFQELSHLILLIKI